MTTREIIQAIMVDRNRTSIATIEDTSYYCYCTTLRCSYNDAYRAVLEIKETTNSKLVYDSEDRMFLFLIDVDEFKEIKQRYCGESHS